MTVLKLMVLMMVTIAPVIANTNVVPCSYSLTLLPPAVIPCLILACYLTIHKTTWLSTPSRFTFQSHIPIQFQRRVMRGWVGLLINRSTYKDTHEQKGWYKLWRIVCCMLHAIWGHKPKKMIQTNQKIRYKLWCIPKKMIQTMTHVSWLVSSFLVAGPEWYATCSKLCVIICIILFVRECHGRMTY